MMTALMVAKILLGILHAFHSLLQVTLISSSPLIFLRLCEITQVSLFSFYCTPLFQLCVEGEMDFAVYPLEAASLNYSQIETLISSTNVSAFTEEAESE